MRFQNAKSTYRNFVLKTKYSPKLYKRAMSGNEQCFIFKQ